MTSFHVFIGRQPILDEKGATVAYELLYRDGKNAGFPGIDGTEATSRILYNLLMTSGIEEITGNRPAFINFTKKMLLSGLPAMDPKRIVIEILEDTLVDAALVETTAELVRKGFRIALDDFTFDASFNPLLGLASVIKVDWRAQAEAEIPRLVSGLNGFRGRFLAEKIETREEYHAARNQGFRLFQGYFFTRPETVCGRDIPTSSWSLLSILSAIQRPEMDIDELTELIGRDPALCQKLLLMVNAAGKGLRQTVSSIRQAIVLLGEQEIRRWFSFLVLYHTREEKTPELLLTACVRARFLEALAVLRGKAEIASALHLAGLLSLLDALLGKPMEECLGRLPLEPAIPDAILRQRGPLRPWLDLVLAHERADVEAVDAAATALGITSMDVIDAYLTAISWSMDCVPFVSTGK